MYNYSSESCCTCAADIYKDCLLCIPYSHMVLPQPPQALNWTHSHLLSLSVFPWDGLWPLSDFSSLDCEIPATYSFVLKCSHPWEWLEAKAKMALPVLWAEKKASTICYWTYPEPEEPRIKGQWKTTLSEMLIRVFCFESYWSILYREKYVSSKQLMMNHNKTGSIIKLQMSLQNQGKHKNILQNKSVACCLLYGIVMNCKGKENRVGVSCIIYPTSSSMLTNAFMARCCSVLCM